MRQLFNKQLTRNLLRVGQILFVIHSNVLFYSELASTWSMILERASSTKSYSFMELRPPLLMIYVARGLTGDFVGAMAQCMAKVSTR